MTELFFVLVILAVVPLHLAGFVGAYFYWQDELVEDRNLGRGLEVAGLLGTSVMLLVCGCFVLYPLVGSPLSGFLLLLIAYINLVFDTSGLLLAATFMCFVFTGRYFGRYKSSKSAGRVPLGLFQMRRKT